MCPGALGLGRRLSRYRGVLDFAGGLVVHLSAGIGGLVAAKVLGRRQGYGTENLSPLLRTMSE
jgi:ammonia channel protein AmtB